MAARSPPWQLRFSAIFITAAILLLFSGAVAPFAQVMLGGAQAFVAAGWTLTAIKVALLVELELLLLASFVAWAGSMLWVWQGRAYSLVLALGSLTIVMFCWLGAAWPIVLRGGDFAPQFVLIPIGLLLIGALVLSCGSRSHFSDPPTGRLALLAKGVGAGTVALTGYIALAFGIPLLAKLMLT